MRDRPRRGGGPPRRAAVALAPGLGSTTADLVRRNDDGHLHGVATRFEPGAPPARLLGEIVPKSALVTPLEVGGERIGYVVLGTLGRATPFEGRDREAIDDLTRRLTSAFAGARLREVRDHAAQLREELLSVVSHELRTPLSTILGWARLMRAEPTNEARRTRGLEVIERSATAQGRIIDDLLDVSRALSGKLRLEPRDVSLAALARDAVTAVRPLAHAKNVILDVTTHGLAMVSVDPDRVRQVVWNLLHNAVKFTPSGGRVQLVVSSANGHASVEIVDTGIGIDPSFLPHVFDRFRRTDASWTHAHGGLGLGLALVRAVVEQHGGSVAAESAGSGRGTKMSVSFPERVTVTEPDAPRTDTVRSASADLIGVRVLVVDDDADARDLCALILGMHGARVSTAENAADAMGRLETEEIDVLVSDIGMPLEDGCSLVRRALERRPTLRCIALSAYARREDSERAIAAGFLRHLAKPVEPRTLVDVVRDVVRPG